MGLSVTATHVIWFFAFLGVTGGAYVAFVDVSHTLGEAEAVRRGIEAETLHADIGDATFCYHASTSSVLVNATNAGRGVLDASNVTFVVNGTLAPEHTESGLDGATAVWAPGAWMEFTLANVTPEPDTLTFTTERGLRVRATKTVCPYLDSIVVTPASATVQVGDSQDLVARGFDQYGHDFAVPSFAWSSDGGTTTELSATSARFTASTVASTTRVVTASVGAVSGVAHVNVSPAAPATLAVTPAGAGIGAGLSRTYTATIYDAYGNVNATAQASWSTNGGSITSGGVLTAQTTAQAGRAVSATSGAASNSASFDVVAAAPTSAVISPASVTVQVGTTQTFSVVLLDAYNNVNSTAPVTWSTDAGSITTGGVLTAQTTSATGKSVTATSGAATATAAVTVSPGPPTSVTVSPSPTTVAAGATQAFSATLRDAYGNVNTTAAITWTTTAGNVSSSGVLTAQTTAQTGRAVTATSNGHAGSATVDVVPGPVDHLTILPASASVPTTHNQSFAATAFDVYNNVVNTTITYSASSGTISSAGLYVAPSTTGSATLTASAGGKSVQATVTITRTLHVLQLLTYNSANQLSNVFNRSETVQTRITIVDQDNITLSGATVSYQLTRSDGSTGTTASVATNAGGIAFFNYTIPNAAANRGPWTDAVTSVSSADANTTYSAAANVVTSRPFNVAS